MKFHILYKFKIYYIYSEGYIKILKNLLCYYILRYWYQIYPILKTLLYYYVYETNILNHKKFNVFILITSIIKMKISQKKFLRNFINRAIKSNSSCLSPTGHVLRTRNELIKCEI